MSDVALTDEPGGADRSLEDLVNQIAVDGDAGELLIRLAEEVEEATATAESAELAATRAMKRSNELRENVRDLEVELDEVREERDELADEVTELRDRTDLLEHVRDASSMKIDDRAAVLIQTLYNEAWRKKSSNSNESGRASMDYKKADGALGGGVSRDMIYRTMQKAETLVDDDSVLEYVKEDRGAKKNTRLRIDLESGELPRAVNGQEIRPPQEGR